MTPPILVPITAIDTLRDAGIAYPSTIDAWRWIYRNRQERGLNHAFVRVGKRILVDVPVYLEALRARAA
jgi:hypothetical protein